MAPSTGRDVPGSKTASATPSTSHFSGKAPSREKSRLTESFEGPVAPWRKWGPYVSERSWGGVREDYSPYGTAWDFLTHAMAPLTASPPAGDCVWGICG